MLKVSMGLLISIAKKQVFMLKEEFSFFFDSVLHNVKVYIIYCCCYLPCLVCVRSPSWDLPSLLPWYLWFGVVGSLLAAPLVVLAVWEGRRDPAADLTRAQDFWTSLLVDFYLPLHVALIVTYWSPSFVSVPR